jgi:hypothetical protein
MLPGQVLVNLCRPRLHHVVLRFCLPLLLLLLLLCLRRLGRLLRLLCLRLCMKWLLPLPCLKM